MTACGVPNGPTPPPATGGSTELAGRNAGSSGEGGQHGHPWIAEAAYWVPPPPLRPAAAGGSEAAAADFVLGGYRMFSRLEVLAALAGRRVMIFGDSMARQIFHAFINHMRGIPASAEHYYHQDAIYAMSPVCDFFQLLSSTDPIPVINPQVTHRSLLPPSLTPAISLSGVTRCAAACGGRQFGNTPCYVSNARVPYFEVINVIRSTLRIPIEALRYLRPDFILAAHHYVRRHACLPPTAAAAAL